MIDTLGYSEPVRPTSNSIPLIRAGVLDDTAAASGFAGTVAYYRVNMEAGTTSWVNRHGSTTGRGAIWIDRSWHMDDIKKEVHARRDQWTACHLQAMTKYWANLTGWERAKIDPDAALVKHLADAYANVCWHPKADPDAIRAL
ncbi:MAG: hypothetical protein M1815_000250 [Lichina confinis]|nr:MAG: hypothetical protein M1815_000250 [Lichina confinis]